MRLYHLRTLCQKNPVGITEHPYFSWRIKSSRQNVFQVSYRIQVHNAGILVWDTGMRESGVQAFVKYEGKELLSGTRYEWNVLVRDNHGEEAGSAGFFETGLLHQEDWKACWIESSIQRSSFEWFPYGEPPAPVRFFRSFWLEKKVKSARLYATAHGIYRVWLNGERPDDREFAPEHTVYDKVLYYQTYDVTKLLREGENQLSFYVGDGWYLCPQTRQDIRAFRGLPAVLYQLVILCEDGREYTFASDGQELCSTGSIVSSDIFLGEKQDAELQWEDPVPVHLAEYSLENLTGQPMPSVCPVKLLPAAAVYTSPRGEKIVDFGQVICGRARIHLDIPKGTEAVFEYFEQSDKEGNYFNSMIAPQKDRYRSDGKACEYEALFTFHGFRYIRVRGVETVRKEDFTAVVLTSYKEDRGSFSCSDPRLNRLYENIRWSQTNNTLSIPTDCPSREKGGFTGDIQIYAKTAMLNEDMTPFLSGWLKNLAAAQEENGSVPITVPETAPYKKLMIQNARSFGDEYPVGVAGWSDAAVLVPYEMYRITGNIRILENQYDSMKKWCDYVIRTARDRRGDMGLPAEVDRYLWNTGFHFGEWLIPNEKVSSHEEACKGSGFYTAPIFGFVSVSRMAEIAGILGRDGDAAVYADVAGKMKEAIGKALVITKGSDGDAGMATENMGAYVLMLYFDLAPREYVKAFSDKLISLLEENGGRLNTGFLATPFLLHVLTGMGRRDLAIRLLWQTQMPSWLYEVEHGATAIWESWDAVGEDGTPKVTSFDHYAFGCVDEWIFEQVAGIRPLEPGFRRFLVAPEPEGLPVTECRRSFICEYGEIIVEWSRERLAVTVPCNTQAVICWKGREYKTGSGCYVFSDTFYKKEAGDGIYSVTHPQWAKTSTPGGAIMQTWVIVGEEKVMAIDSPIPEIAGFRSYLEQEFEKPVLMVLSHGHIDHIGCIGQFEQVYLSKRDWPLLLGGGVKPAENLNGLQSLLFRLEDLQDHMRISLGNREILCIPIPGHTPGSMVFYDEKSRSMFTGDSVARRVLYGLSGYTPLEQYLNALRRLKQYPVDRMYSMHDDFALPGDFPERIISRIKENLCRTTLNWQPPGDKRRFRRILLGENEADPEFFDFVIPVDAEREVVK